MKKTSLILVLIVLAGLLQGAAALAADSPEAVYETYLKAFRNEDLKKVLSCMSANMNKLLKDNSPNDATAALKGAKDFIPVEVKVNHKKITGKQATLLMEGTQKDSKKNTSRKIFGKVEFVSENGEWKINNEMWDTKPVK